MTVIEVDGYANKEVENDLAEVYIDMRIACTAMMHATSKYNAVMERLKKEIKEVDTDAVVSASGVRAVSGVERVKRVFNLTKFVDNSFVVARVNIKYKDKPEVLNKAIEVCEEYNYNTLDKNGQCFLYTTYKYTYMSKEVEDEARTVATSLAIANAKKKCNDVMHGFTDSGVVVDFSTLKVKSVTLGGADNRSFGAKASLSSAKCDGFDGIDITQDVGHSNVNAKVKVEFEVEM